MYIHEAVISRAHAFPTSLKRDQSTEGATSSLSAQGTRFMRYRIYDFDCLTREAEGIIGLERRIPHVSLRPECAARCASIASVGSLINPKRPRAED